MQPDPILAQIYPDVRRSDVQIRLPNGKIYGGPAGLPLEAFIQKAAGSHASTVMAAAMNNRLVELSEPVLADADVYPVSATTAAGLRIYQRSVIFLLEAAAHEIDPGTRLAVEHSLSFGGLYCRLLNRHPFSAEELVCLEARMREIAALDIPIERQEMSLTDAVALFEKNGDASTAALMAQGGRPRVSLHKLRGVLEYFFDGQLVASTGYVKQVSLRPYASGFAMEFPSRGHPIEPVKDNPKLTSVFREYGEGLSKLGVPDVATLNRALLARRGREIVLVAEALHDQRIAHIASQITAHRGELDMVLIAGPSASGKTTFARRLSIQLLAHHLRPFPISLDDYFLPRDATPADATGRPDFEALTALDLALLNTQMVALTRGERVTLPRYNFVTGQPEEGETVQLTPEHILVLEGIHGLNPALLPDIPSPAVFRIYASALTQLKFDHVNRIPTTDTRLIRRIVRDARARGYSAQDTINRWESVVRGEDQHIFPFQENADAMFNSALVYELAALKPLAEPLLRQVEPDMPEYIEARRMLAFLQWFQPCETPLVPEDSILREFIGGSVVSDFIPQV
ncbi:MAG: nucleoside kinase [Anaerolineae bacterium]